MQSAPNKLSLDYFKLFKIFQLKKLQKHGDVKIIHDKQLSRKILAVEGNVSTQNYYKFETKVIAQANPAINFNKKYLYIVGYAEPSRNFCFELTLDCNGTKAKFLFSTLYKIQKMGSNKVFHMPLGLKSSIWTILVFDISQLCQKIISKQEKILSSRVESLEIRANSKIKNIYQSDYLYDPASLPKDMELPLKGNENYYQKYNYLLIGQKPMNSQQNHSIPSNIFREGDVQKKQSLDQSKVQVGTSQRQTIPKETKINKKPTFQNKMNKKNKKEINSPETIQYSLVSIEDKEDIPRIQKTLRPQVTLSTKLMALEGNTIYSHNIVGLEAFVVHPTIFAVHKPIKLISVKKDNPLHVVFGYTDGSISIWDIIRKKSLGYLKTDIKTIKALQLTQIDGVDWLYVVGTDSKKRQMIIGICNNEVVYQKVSTFPIGGVLMPNSFKQIILVTYGYQNIRIWRPNIENGILNGVGLYLGKMNIKVTYKGGCQVSEEMIYVIDSAGYLTSINFREQKTLEISRVSECQLDHIINISQIHKLLIIDSTGSCQIMDYELNVEEEYELKNRVKNVCYEINGSEVVLKIEHWNKSLAKFNIGTGEYSFLMRSHNQPIISLEYMGKLGKIVSISKDNTIRIWQLCQKQHLNHGILQLGEMQWDIKQQYEFVLQTGQSMSVVGVDKNQHAYIGMNSGKIRKIDVCNFKIIGQVDLRSILCSYDNQYQNSYLTIIQFQMSKNGKNILISIQVSSIHNNNSQSHCLVLLADSDMNLIHVYPCPTASGKPKNQTVLCKFNEMFKKFMILWTYGTVAKVQTFSMSNPESSKAQIYIQGQPIKISYQKSQIGIEIKGKNEHIYQIYNEQSGQLQKVININNMLCSKKQSAFCTNNYVYVEYPFVIYSNEKDQLEVAVFSNKMMKRKIIETLDLPQRVNNIKLLKNVEMDASNDQNTNKSQNLIICSGINSYAIYAINLQAINLEQALENDDNLQMNNNQSKPNQQILDHEMNNQFLVMEQKKKGKHFVQKIEEIPGEQQASGEEEQMIKQIGQQPKKLQGLYEEQQRIFEEVKYAIFGENLMTENDSQNQSDYNPEKYIRSQGQQQKQGLQLIYGWNNKYPGNKSKLFWYPESQSVLFYCQYAKALVLHYFKEPVTQKIVHLPLNPHFIAELIIRNNGKPLNSHTQSIGVGMGNQLKIYDINLNYSKTLITVGEAIINASISTCSNFLILLSKDARQLFIQIFDFITTSVISMTYLEVQPQQQISIKVNPFQTCLQFILETNVRILFYRLTSILTLQVQQLPKIRSLVNDVCGDITCTEFLKCNSDGQEVILIGTANGSIIVADARAAEVLIVCKQILNQRIINIMCIYQNDIQQLSMAITTTSSTLNFYKTQEQNSLNTLISVLERSPFSQMTIDSEIYSHSLVHQISENELGVLLMSKFNVLWLIDLKSGDTIKILSSHSQPTKSLSLCQSVAIQKYKGFLSGGNDGYVKFTSLKNLQQTNQIFKPKKKVKSILYVPKDINSVCDLLVAAFSSQIYYYQFLSPSNWRYLGSVKMNSQIVDVKHMLYSNNFVVCCQDSLSLVYINIQSKFIVEIQQISCGITHPLSLQTYGYNLVLVRQLNKVDVWIRKQNRGENILKQLSEKIHEVKYYMMDSYQCSAISCEFITFEQSKHNNQCKEYVGCMIDRPKIQFRDFQEHIIIKQIELQIDSPTSMLLLSDNYSFCIGNQYGYLHTINENGLILSKSKIFGGPIKAITQYKVQEGNKAQLLVSGESIALVNTF